MSAGGWTPASLSASPSTGEFSPEDQAKIDDVEARVAAVIAAARQQVRAHRTLTVSCACQAPPICPTRTKLKAGRVACQAPNLLWFNDASHPLDAFPRDEEATTTKQEKSESSDKLGAEHFQELLEYGTVERAPAAMLSSRGVASCGEGKTAKGIVDGCDNTRTGLQPSSEAGNRLDDEIKRSFKKFRATYPRLSPSGTSSTPMCSRAARARCCRNSRPPKATPISSCCRQPRFTNGMPIHRVEACHARPTKASSSRCRRQNSGCGIRSGASIRTSASSPDARCRIFTICGVASRSSRARATAPSSLHMCMRTSARATTRSMRG